LQPLCHPGWGCLLAAADVPVCNYGRGARRSCRCPFDDGAVRLGGAQNQPPTVLDTPTNRRRLDLLSTV